MTDQSLLYKMSKLQNAEITSLVIAHANENQLLPMLEALMENSVVFTEADCREICNRNLQILYDFVQRYVNINSILQHGQFRSMSLDMLKYFESCNVDLNLLDKILPYAILNEDCANYFIERGLKLDEHFKWVVENYYEDTPGYVREMQKLLDQGFEISENFLETHYSVFLLTKFPPVDNPILQLQTIMNDCVEVMQYLDLKHTHYTVDSIVDTVLYDDTERVLAHRITFTALDYALISKSWKVAKMLIEENADISDDLNLAYPDDIRELLFYNYPSLPIDMEFNINRAKELWNPTKRRVVATLAGLRLDSENIWGPLANELLFEIIKNL